MTQRNRHEVSSISCLPFCSQIAFCFILSKVKKVPKWKFWKIIDLYVYLASNLVTVSSTKHWLKIVSSWVSCHTTSGWLNSNVFLTWQFVSNEMLLCMNILTFVKSWNKKVEQNLQRGPLQDWSYTSCSDFSEP